MFSLVVLISAISLLSLPTHAEENKSAFEFSVISMNDTLNGDKKLSAKDAGDGVFVTVTSGWTPYPKTTAIVKDMLKAKGIKVVDKPEEATVGIQFATGSMDLSEIEDNEDAGINKERVTAAVISAFATGGGSLIGEMWHPSTNGKPLRAVMMARFANSPKVSSRGTIGGEDMMFVGTDMVFQSNQEGHEVTKAAFMSYIAHFADAHFEISRPSAIPNVAPLNK